MPVPDCQLQPSHPILVLALLLGLTGTAVRTKPDEIEPKETKWYFPGDTASLNCKVASSSLPGPVLWFKGERQDRKLIYNFKGDHFPRVTAAVRHTKGGGSDFSIDISNITLADAGIYYCVKRRFQQTANSKEDFKTEQTTRLSVYPKPSPPVVSGPVVRATPGQTVNFTCKSHGFAPREITLQWFKDRNELSGFQTRVDPVGEGVSYNLTSTVKVLLDPRDIYSQVICEVTHVTLWNGPPLRGTANLSDFIQVFTSLEVAQQPMVTKNQRNVTCRMKEFYPSSLQLRWLGNENVFLTETGSALTENINRMYNRVSWLQVNMCAQTMVLACQAWHDGKLVATKNLTLEISALEQGQNNMATVITAVLLVCKVPLAVVISAIYVQKRWIA